ncbi:MAG: RNA polymerase sigma factor [Actinobacteria bacterium]|nr:RNA polymerase sigma factor [Actinomycetota bacterium]
MTDEEIIAASFDDPPVFGELFERHFTTIHGYLSRRLGRARADDLAGEVFRIGFVERSKYDPSRGGLRSWLYGIANNVLRQHLRDRERAERAWARLGLSSVVVDDVSPVERIDAQLLAARLDAALARLLPTDREALTLHVVEQLTYAEVALVMNTPIGTVRSRIARARNQLRVSLAFTADSDTRHEGADHG